MEKMYYFGKQKGMTIVEIKKPYNPIGGNRYFLCVKKETTKVAPKNHQQVMEK